MDNTVVYIKCISGSDPLKQAYMSYKEDKPHYYNLDSADEENLKYIDKNDSHYIVFIEYKESEIKTMLIGSFNWQRNSAPRNDSLKYNITNIIDSEIIIKNIAKLSELNLTEDFKESKYVMFEDSEFISSQLSFIICDCFEPQRNEYDYESIDSEEDLCPLAQKNEYCKRYYNYVEPVEQKGEYQSDFERIISSKAFRRMVDKAQVFSASKGDYYRTRMTHTQLVAQVAGAISEALKLNYYLTQAIAFGHDIGHTPFGHQGERTLNRILTETDSIIKNKSSFENNLGGFKHNYQSLRIATNLEETYTGIYGMDLSYQTLEGILKHTSIKNSSYKLEEFCDYIDCVDLLHLDVQYPTTLEGQVVAIADEIAQRGHDLDDALESNSITLDELKSFLSIKKTQGICSIIDQVENELFEVENNNRRFSDEASVRNNLIVSKIMEYFINDIITTSSQNIDSYINSDLSDFESHEHRVNKRLICLSDEAANICNILEIIVTNKVINSNEIALFDSNADTIITGLFKAYYNNPRLLHSGTLKRITNELKKATNNVIDFQNSNYEVVQKEINIIVHQDLENTFVISPSKKEEYLNKRKVLIRAICDYIAGMTDSYAKTEYSKIVK